MAESTGLNDVPDELKTHRTFFGYVNPWRDFQRPSLWQLYEWMLKTPNNSNIPDNKEELDRVMPVLDLNIKKINDAPEDKFQVTWLGQASVLTQFEGLTVLADPIFRDFCGPEIANTLGFGKLAYWKYRESSCKNIDMSVLKLDAVIISHNHVDHLDEGTIRDIAKKHRNITWFVGMGLKPWMEKRGCNNVVELEWWTEQDLEVGSEANRKTFRFICVPTQHWSIRGLFDKNQTLWCSWVVKGANTSYYFAGDTGYYKSLFETIGKKYGPFDLSAIPIGSYSPRSILEYQHVDPEQAVMIHQDIKSQCSIGIHWGTFKTTACEYYLEPPQKVEELMKSKGLGENSFVSLNHGETWVVGADRVRPKFMDVPPPVTNK